MRHDDSSLGHDGETKKKAIPFRERLARSKVFSLKALPASGSARVAKNARQDAVNMEDEEACIRRTGLSASTHSPKGLQR
eukprot:1141570-Pleurochrysis_carterae.AAC.4